MMIKHKHRMCKLRISYPDLLITNFTHQKKLIQNDQIYKKYKAKELGLQGLWACTNLHKPTITTDFIKKRGIEVVNMKEL